MPSSELIVNPDGTIYHLGLLPEHIPDLIVTVGDPERVGAVSSYFDKISFRQNRREFCTHVGSFAERPIMCISTGIGTDNVDIVLNEIDALVNVDLETGEPKSSPRQITFVRLGTSGIIQRDTAVNTILVSESAVGLDGLGASYGFPQTYAARRLAETYRAWAGHAYGADADYQLAKAWLDRYPSHVSGVTITCAGFYGPQLRLLRLPFTGPSPEALEQFQYGNTGEERFSNFEMETAGIYALAAALGHRALSVSALLANRITGEFSQRPGEVVEELISNFFELAREGAFD